MKDKNAKIKRRVKGFHVVDGAGVHINRIIGSPDLDHIDPFVLLDEIRSSHPDDYIAGFPTHPHRGIETITYMIHGRFRHRDSRGGGGLLTDGCVQWMTAGRGILHSEMPEPVEGELQGYQLWLSLPARHKMVEARYQHLSPEMIPVVEHKGIKVYVISGEFGGKAGPAENWVKTDYFDVRAEAGAEFIYELEEGVNSFLYVHTGEVETDGEQAGPRELVELSGGDSAVIRAGSPGAGFLFLCAHPNNEPIARGGPFVMNTAEEIRQAFEDYRNGVLK